jgi:hypothetical protein
MEEMEISMKIKPIYLERLLYWIIILVLAVLLVIAWADDTVTDETDTKTVGQEQGAGTVTPPAEETPVAEPEESCSDGSKNQDETDIDCGGDCTKCALTKACAVNSDCISGICSQNVCVKEAPVTLSGKMEMDVTAIDKTIATNNGAVKVTALTFTVKNGLEDDYDQLLVKVYVKNKGGTRCYNQQTPGLCDDSYAEFFTGAVKSGKTLTTSKSLSKDDYTSKVGNFVVDDTSAPASEFQVVAYVYDKNGNEIDGKSISDAIVVKA